MGFWSRVFGGEAKAETITSSLDLFREIYGGRESNSGVVVNWKTALDVSTVLANVRVIANGISQVPFGLYLDDGKSRAMASDHPLHLRLRRRPNAWQTSYEFRETIMFHVLLTGNAFVFVNRVGSAREIREMVPIEPGRVMVKQRDDYSIEYTVTGANGRQQVFEQDAIWHLRGPSWNSWMGMEAVKMARDAIGLSMSLEQGQAEFQKNGARPSANYAVTDKLSPEKFEFLAKWLDRHQPGGDRYGKPVITDSGAKFTAMVMSAVDQQLIETRKHQIEEICRAFGVMPIMVGHADKTATYASAEQMFLAHVVHTLSPWYQRIEQSADANLLSEKELAEGYYTKFTPNALMRGAAADRAAFYTAALGTTQQPGWMVRNEVRALEDLDPVDGGDKFPELITAQPKTPQTDPAS